jgi:hypothetical protein
MRSDEDALPHEHEQQHEALVEKLIRVPRHLLGAVGRGKLFRLVRAPVAAQ